MFCSWCLDNSTWNLILIIYLPIMSTIIGIVLSQELCSLIKVWDILCYCRNCATVIKVWDILCYRRNCALFCLPWLFPILLSIMNWRDEVVCQNNPNSIIHSLVSWLGCMSGNTTITFSYDIGLIMIFPWLLIHGWPECVLSLSALR